MAFAVFFTLLPLLGLLTNVALGNNQEVLWPGGSQFPPLHHRMTREDAPDAGVDPRVGPLTTMGPGTVPLRGAVKNSGETTGNAPLLTHAKKRAFRRARRRAEIKGGTMYKGRWCSAQELETNFLSEGMPSEPTRRRREVRTGWQAASRLKVRTYNIGGITSEVYDVLHRWLTSNCTDDVVVVQELHHGCGKTDHSWTIPGWTVAITADERNRFSGVGVFISHRIAPADRVSFHTWLPGRLMHVRCFTSRVTVDIIAGYQWVWQGRHQEAISANRSLFWGKLSALMQTLPMRNLVVVAMDANTQLQSLPGLVGRGVLRTTQNRDPEFEALLQAQNLVVLNSWGSSARLVCHTFVNGEVYSRRPMADATARRAKPESLDLTSIGGRTCSTTCWLAVPRQAARAATEVFTSELACIDSCSRWGCTAVAGVP